MFTTLSYATQFSSSACINMAFYSNFSFSLHFLTLSWIWKFASHLAMVIFNVLPAIEVSLVMKIKKQTYRRHCKKDVPVVSLFNPNFHPGWYLILRVDDIMRQIIKHLEIFKAFDLELKICICIGKFCATHVSCE